MLLAHDPSEQEISILIDFSQQRAAKWTENPHDHSKWFWPAEQAFHAEVASLLKIPEYEKGLAVVEQNLE